MAVGGHHGGGFHSGGHHSGGFHSSGGFGGGHSGGGHYYGGGSGDSEISLFLCVIAIVIYIFYKIGSGEVPGVDFVVLGMFIASTVFFVLSFKEYERTSLISDIKKNKGERLFGQLWKGYAPPKSKNGNNRSWAFSDGSYRIALFDPDYGDENLKKVRELIQRTPKIVWMSSFVWLIIGIVCLFSTFFFYELVIPTFENMVMTDEAFALVDNLVFYTPGSIALISSIACFVFVKIRDNLLYKCAVRIVEDNIAMGERMKTKEGIAEILSKKWYYNYCPNCGAPASPALRSCTSCGSSLEVHGFSDGNTSSVHQIKTSAEKVTAEVKGAKEEPDEA